MRPGLNRVSLNNGGEQGEKKFEGAVLSFYDVSLMLNVYGASGGPCPS